MCVGPGGDIALFFKEEGESALLTKNDCFDPSNYEEYRRRVESWVDLVRERARVLNVEFPEVDRDHIEKNNLTVEPHFIRIFQRDADRTLFNVLRKAEFMECLKLGNVELKDYHQGYG